MEPGDVYEKLADMYVVQPAVASWFGCEWEDQGKPLEDGFRYASNTNDEWLTIEQIQKIVAPIEEQYLNGKLS